MYLPLGKVADTHFHIQGDDLFIDWKVLSMEHLISRIFYIMLNIIFIYASSHALLNPSVDSTYSLLQS